MPFTDNFLKQRFMKHIYQKIFYIYFYKFSRTLLFEI